MSDAPARIAEDGRVVVYGPGALTGAGDLLGAGYTLLTTARAAAACPDLVAGAGAVVHVPHGRVEDAAAKLRGTVPGRRWVTLGGGRVVDVAKALAAADPPREIVAVPTTLSAAEMTGGHRHLPGLPDDTPKVRPGVVINDPALSASAPAPALAASSANALGHAVTALCADGVDEATRARARRAVALLGRGWAGTAPDPAALAEGAMLAGWALDHAGLGLHHALAQTAVRVAGVGHAPANAALLPESTSALRRRHPERLAAVERETGVDLDALSTALRRRAGDTALAALEDDAGLLERMVATVMARPEPGRLAPAPDAGEIRAAYLAAARAASGAGPPAAATG